MNWCKVYQTISFLEVFLYCFKIISLKYSDVKFVDHWKYFLIYCRSALKGFLKKIRYTIGSSVGSSSLSIFNISFPVFCWECSDLLPGRESRFSNVIFAFFVNPVPEMYIATGNRICRLASFQKFQIRQPASVFTGNELLRFIAYLNTNIYSENKFRNVILRKRSELHEVTSSCMTFIVNIDL